ncbi:carboxymuconolactone decarboxylase family protein [Kitasatospora herbaricolor]|uniref:carboxymuconolactone decarboxylase family protein n=1 Tax=Kitasatospora herbaricolor TaxID=68217 RepID=UPI0036DD6189
MAASDASGAPGQAAGAVPPLLEVLTGMTLGAFEASGLDEESYLLVRIAALVAMGAAPDSYLLNVAAARRSGILPERIRGVLVALAPLVGTARIVAAARSLEEALGVTLLAPEPEPEPTPGPDVSAAGAVPGPDLD